MAPKFIVVYGCHNPYKFLSGYMPDEAEQSDFMKDDSSELPDLLSSVGKIFFLLSCFICLVGCLLVPWFLFVLAFAL